MKKILLFLSFLIFSTNISAQLDREHWFAPMFDGQMNLSGYEQFLHLSTNETTPFTVYIYSNNILIDQKIISKGAPGVVEIPREYIITDDNYDELNKVITKGLYVKGDRPLFANLRFGVTNHSEIITSKGTAGIGKEFYTVMAPNEQTSLYFGSTASFLATEDNTTVTLSNFKKIITFNGFGTPASITFTLNKGQSYIIDARTSDSFNNKDGFIGAKVISDKPISMTNGNFNGQYASSTASGSDILMDQSVPVDKLGDEFVIVKGNGKIGNNMEGAIIVATEKNTSIYLNDATTPIKILANEGDYYRVSETNYVNRGNEHYNLHVTTNKNVYVYQLLAGVELGTAALATGGMNYIPPLNCYLPRKIDEISYINKIQETDSDNRFITKLNIITEKGATVKVNGVIPSSVNGPYDVSNIAANQQWVSYSIPNVKGNITVESDKAVTAGIASGNDAFGYGGYFAGFSAIPLILKIEGECLPGVKLSVTEGFSLYQWLIKDVSGSYSPAPGVNNTNIYQPPKAGIYAVKIQQGSCPEIQTQDFKFYNCTTYTNVNYETCAAIDEIAPVFSLSTQTPGIPIITEPAKKGTATVLANGKIKYVATAGESGTDTFKFSFCGLDTIPDCETTQVTVNIDPIIGQDDVLVKCNINGIATYDLSKAKVTTARSKVEGYYKSKNAADNQITSQSISNFTSYPSPEGFVYARVKSNLGCVETETIELKFYPTPDLLSNVYEDCENVLKGKVEVKLNTVAKQLLKDPVYFTTVKFYLNGKLLNNDWSYSSDTVVQMEVQSPDGCPAKTFPINFKVKAKTPLISNNQTIELCDDDLDSILKIENLDNYKTLFTDKTVTAQFYLSKNDTQVQTEVSVNEEKTLYVVISNGTDCQSLAELTIKIKIPKKSDSLKGKTICPDDKTDLDAGLGFDKYEWYSETDPTKIIGSDHNIPDLEVGKYFVILKGFYPNDCIYKQNVEIKAAELPTIESIEITGSTVKINVKGGRQPYRYAIDGGNYQDSNIFSNLAPGLHKAYVISADNCDPVEKEFSVIEIYNVITPNSDGVNDVLDMSLLKLKVNPKFNIFDRAGRKLFEGDTKNNFIWDGRENGKTLPTSSYWYMMEWQDFDNSPAVKFTGWILLKNRNSN